MFAEPRLDYDKRIEFYQHDIDWSNRIILGDSLLVMNSLLEKELMAGKVQMIYMDPPYGINYNSNFQPSIRQTEVQDRDDDFTREPEQIKAYRDTWELNIHSYLTYLRDRVLLAYDLLSESGSLFLQISDKNLHHARAVVDEIFRPENFVSIIAFRKKGMTLGKKTLENMYDFIIWYAKNKEKMKYHQLFIFDDGSETRWDQVELPDGTIRATTKEEKENPAVLPKGAKPFNPFPTNSPTFDKEAVYDVKWKGKTYHPLPNQSWITRDKQKILRLLEMGRMFPYGKSLAYKQYLADFPYKKLTSIWHDTRLTGKLYAVQTATKVIQRCMLMTTDAGDLVIDPTCGSGTTAFVAEEWGRRWITCDTSRVAIAIAKQRLMTAVFDYYTLSHPDEGVVGGFKYKTVPRTSLRSLAKNEPAEIEALYDVPEIDRKRVRVSGPFTFEAIPSPIVQDPSNQQDQKTIETVGRPSDPGGDHVDDMLEILRKSRTINFPNGKSLALENIIPLSENNILHVKAEAINGHKTRIAISFGPRYGPIGVKQLEAAIRAAQWEYDMLVLVGLIFDPEVQAFIQKNPHPQLSLQLAHINPDVIANDLLKTPKGSQIFTVYGQPDIDVKKNKIGEYTVQLKGVDIYDPITGKTSQSQGENVAAWLLDTDYDGYTFRIVQALFPSTPTSKNPWDKLENALHDSVDIEKFEQLRKIISIPFKAGENNRIAVKVIDYRGNEVITVRDLNE